MSETNCQVLEKQKYIECANNVATFGRCDQTLKPDAYQNEIINLRRSRNFLRPTLFGCSCDPHFIQFALGSCYTVHINALKVDIKRNNMQVELIRFRKKNRLYPRLRFRIEEIYVYSIFAR